MSDNQIKCVALKINEAELLLPNAAIAEIVPIKNIINVANKPVWMLGYLDWRGNSVPLISFEAMGGVRMPSLASGTVKAAVLFSIGENQNIPYVALLVQGAPGVIEVKEEELLTAKEEILHPAIEEKVLLGENHYSLVNIEKLEAIVQDVMTH